MSKKSSKAVNRVKMSSSERKRSKHLKQASSPLRERYLEDLRLHKFSDRTIGSYLEAVLRMVLHTNLNLMLFFYHNLLFAKTLFALPEKINSFSSSDILAPYIQIV